MEMAIETKDTVQVTKPFKCCGYEFGMGVVFIVQAVQPARGRCPGCHAPIMTMFAMKDSARNTGFPAYILTNFGRPECHA